MPSLAPYVLRIPFKDGLKEQEVRFQWKPESLQLINRNGWCWVYLNGRSYVKFSAETTLPGVRHEL